MKIEIIAFYLPQFHPTPHNNEWWGEGFTEWTNVAKAKPLYPGHYQPKIPADLGFYDLRMPEIREKQAILAKEAGVTGFCYYHYWFGDGEQELELPFNQVVESKQPNFPFCLCWANETWSQKFWNADGSVVQKKDLAVQKYLGEEDDTKHFYSLLKAFKDERYIRVDGKPLFVIYRPLSFDGITRFIKLWNSLAKENGIEGFYFVGYTNFIEEEFSIIKNLGFDGVVSYRSVKIKQIDLRWLIRRFISKFIKIPIIIPYKKIYPRLIQSFEKKHDEVIPTMLPNWDHTPRSGYNGYLFSNSTPKLFQIHAEETLKAIKDKKEGHKICFLKSWNEWGEGNYMEPDLKYGKGYIKALRNAINNVFLK